ncbi:MAG TPA: C40 family peptidase [Gemmatimonadaceae bacterium]|nr:C40 family peptidase [Gemmatimonadaceae bacterium]
MRAETDTRIGLFAVLLVSATTTAVAALDPPRAPAVGPARTAEGSVHVTAHGEGTYAAPQSLQPMILGALQDSVVALALAQLGMPYVLGGTTPRGFDCSGLVRWVTAQVHMPMPRTAKLQALAGTPVRRDALEPGDLVAFGDDQRVSHVGIYVGGGRFVHASSVAGRVVVSRLDRQPSRLIRPMRAARRILASAERAMN